MSSMPTVSDSRRRRLRQSLTAAEAMASAAPSQPFVLRLREVRLGVVDLVATSNVSTA